MPLSTGERFGPYEILSPLGAGGMGEVYRARDTKLRRDVALKVLSEGFGGDPGRMMRFQREAEVLASLNHPNIAAIYGVEERALAMELVEGESPQGPLPFEEAWEIAAQIADALDYAHEKGVIHRDLKPPNIKVTPDGVVKLLDFGLAKALSEPSSSGNSTDSTSAPTMTMGATVAGVIMGTPAYMSPEQARGKNTDRRTDNWAFGVVLYELLAGKTLFQGGDMTETLANVVKDQPDLSGAPPRVRRLLEACLEKDPRKRLQSMGDIRYLLADPVESPAAVPKTRPHSQLGWIVALAVTVVAAAALWMLRGSGSRTAPAVRLSMEVAPAEKLGPAPYFSRPAYTSMAVSPDGNTVVFRGVRGTGSTAQLQLYKRSLDRQNATPIPGTEGAAEPFFSPDGQWVGFFAGGKLSKVPMNGGPAAIICDSGVASGAHWASADSIVFALGRRGILQVSSAGGMPQEIVKADPAKRGESYGTPQLVANGKTLLYTLANLRQLGRRADHRPASRYRRAALAHQRRSGRALCFHRPPGVFAEFGLMAVPFDAQKAQLTGPPVAMLDAVMQSVNMPNGAYESGMGQFAISASGNLIYAPGGAAPPLLETLVRVDRKGAETDLGAPKAFYSGVRVSPDGQRLVTGKARENSRISDIWSVDIHTGNSTRLSSSKDGSGYPLWSPDGKRVLFGGGSDGSQFLSFAADGGGAAETVMTIAPGTFAASLSGAGDLLVYLERRDRMLQVWIKPMSGPGEPKRFSESQFNHV